MEEQPVSTVWGRVILVSQQYDLLMEDNEGRRAAKLYIGRAAVRTSGKG